MKAVDKFLDTIHGLSDAELTALLAHARTSTETHAETIVAAAESELARRSAEALKVGDEVSFGIEGNPGPVPGVIAEINDGDDYVMVTGPDGLSYFRNRRNIHAKAKRKGKTFRIAR